MKYYYLTPEGTTAGPETLANLAAMMAGGAVTVATLVVPVGGQDWTPLARVLRYYYADAAGGTVGPVAFSELHRLNQIAVLGGSSWVLEEGGSEWKALNAVLRAGGVASQEPAPVSQIPRSATGAYQPQAGSPYAAPRTAGRTVVVHHHRTGGIGRLAYFVFSILISAICFGGIYAALGTSFTDLNAMTQDQLNDKLAKVMPVVGLLYLGTMVGFIILVVQRQKNIGWPWYAVFFLLVPIFSAIYSLALTACPAGYARSKKLDGAGKAIIATVVTLFVGSIIFLFAFWGRFEKEFRRLEEEAKKNVPKPAMVFVVPVLRGY